ncbi:MAG: hypothetical protein ACREFS_11745 [Acetobacteraceae bacterium]
MANFAQGERVAVPVDVQPGPFPGEHLVTVSTLSGPVSGFVQEQDFVQRNKTIRAVVSSSAPESLKVHLSGSYFTTNGLVEFSPDWAGSNVMAIA